MTPLEGSLEAIDVAPALSRLPQRHFVGAEDELVPPFIARAFVRAIPAPHCATVTVVPGAGHADGWVERWAELSVAVPAC